MIPTFPMTSQINQAMETIQRCADQLPDGYMLAMRFDSTSCGIFLLERGFAVTVASDEETDHPIVTAVREARRRAGLDDGIPKEAP